MKRSVIRFALLLFFLGGALGAFAAPEPLRVGWIGPLTGSGAALGVDSVVAVQMAFEAANAAGGINGQPLELLVEDDQYLTENSVRAYQHLLRARGVRLFFIYSYSGLFALSERARADGAILLDPLDCDEDIAALPKHVICIAKKTEELGRVIAADALERGVAPAAILHYESDAFGVKVADSVAKILTAAGHPPLFVQGYPAGTMDYRSILLRAKQLGARSLFFLGGEETGTAIKQAHSLGLTAQFYALAFVLSPEVQLAAGPALNGTIFPNWRAQRTPRFQSFLAELTKRQGRPPILEISTVPSYDAAQLLVSALRSAKSTPLDIRRDAVLGSFYQVHDYPGVSGTVTIDPDGAVRSFAISLHRINDGKVSNLNEGQHDANNN